MARSSQAKTLQLDLDREGAKALVAQVGERQQRLLRELEKLALEHGPGASIGAEEVEESCATSAERKVWTLADALVAGDRQTSIELLLELRQQGERVTGLIYNMVRRLRDAVAVAEALAGRPVARAGQEDAADAAARRGQVRQGRRRRATSSRCAARSRRWPTSRSTTRGQAAAGCSEDTAAVRAVLAAAA